uniref:Titin n=1 Tax=Gouania willdenowi TaxID=441366 RepID=A0A8C5DU22_GOUWI
MYKAIRLNTGSEYQFRVKAKNRYGTGPPITSEAKVAAYPFKVPGPPGTPNVVAYTKDSITIGWNEPVSDGGNEVIGYHVERKERSGIVWYKVSKAIVKGNIFRSSGLEDGVAYEFRVMAENMAGIGKPSKASEPILALDPVDPPGQPVPTFVNKNNITIQWTKPEYDGGFKITGYTVEKRELPAGRWSRANFTNIIETSFTVSGLTQDTAYEFRVIARNSAGAVSLPSDPSDPTTCKDDIIVPRIMVDAIFKDVVLLKAGESFKLDADIGGQPTPSMAWTKNGKEVENTLKLEVRYTDLTTTLTNKDSIRSDGGEFVLTGYVIEKRESSRLVWTNVASDLQLTEHKVTKLLKGNEYIFRVMAEYMFRVAARNEKGTSDPRQIGVPVIVKDLVVAPVAKMLFNTFSVLAGEDLTVDVPYVARPKAAVSWVKDGQPLKRTTRVNFSSTETLLNLSIKEATKDDDRTEEPDLDIDPELRKIVTINAGTTLRLFIPIRGRPTPAIKWVKDEAPLKETAQLETTSSYTSLVIDKMSRNDSGKYTITAENSSGTMSAGVVVRVLDTPSAPTNLKIKEITNQSVTFEWQPPLLDGGSKIKNYIIEKRESTRKTYAAVVTNCHALSWKIEPLQEGCSYYFRVLAENAHGVGLPTATVDPLKVSEVPQTPKSLMVTDQTKTSISLAWEKPEYDGGSRVLQYLLEVQLKGQEKWNNVNTFKTMEATVSNLNPGEEYLFRVTAINDKGKSEPKVLAGPVMAKDLVFEPDVRPQFSCYSVHVGKDMDINIPIFGRPKPAVTWTKDGAPLKFTTRVNINNTPTHTTLSIKEAATDDGGMYGVTVINPAGQRDTTVEIIVLDKPGAPSGPVRFDEITTQSITISWDPPKHNGGCQVSNYIVQKRDTTTTTWENVNINCARTSIKVPRLKTGAEYQFRIIAQNRYGKSCGLDSSSVVAQYPYREPGPPEAIHVTKDTIVIQWTKPEYDGGSNITGYTVEKRDLPEGRWVRANFTNVIDTQFTVTGLTENAQYDFRVIAKNAVGTVSKPSYNSGPITASDNTEAPKFSIDPAFSKTIIINAGETFTLDADVRGKPLPTIKWFKNEKPFENTLRQEIRNTETHAMIVIKDSIRIDSGVYTLQLTNEAGTETNEGGSEITNYIIEKKD